MALLSTVPDITENVPYFITTRAPAIIIMLHLLTSCKSSYSVANKKTKDEENYWRHCYVFSKRQPTAFLISNLYKRIQHYSQ